MPTNFELCAGCGAAAASAEQRCGVCGTAYARPAPVAALDAQVRWARLECRFRCPSCDSLSPVNHLELDGQVVCAHCGGEHRFDVQVWTRVLPWAHDVVSLSAIDPAVRAAPPDARLVLDNPYHDVAITAADRSWEQADVVGGHGALVARISPGHPLCPGCGTPCIASAQGAGRLVLACLRCNVRSAYELKREAGALHAAMTIVAAAEYRIDVARAQARFGDRGVAAVTCSSCGAPLEVAAGATTVVCAHCRAPSLVPSKLWFRLGVGEPHVEPMWVLFDGSSARRRALDSKDVDPVDAEIRAGALAALGEAGPAMNPMLLRAIAFGLMLLLGCLVFFAVSR